MKTNNFPIAVETAKELCIKFEGFSPIPYLCPAKKPTIGYGSTYYLDGRKVAMGDASITKHDAEELLATVLVDVADGVHKLCPDVTDSARLGAIIDFTYNVGIGNFKSSTLLKKVKSEDWAGAQNELKKWVYGGGKILPGLVTRRNAEAQLFK